MYQAIIDFWFKELEPKQWWIKDSTLDNLIRQRFSEQHMQAKAGELFSWRETAAGSLAEVIILDQFSRNIFRDSAQAFACDAQALTLAQTAIAKGLDAGLPAAQRSFLYMPFMHSESKHIHTEAVRLFTALGNKENLAFELKHKAIIDRFGRYPHRNASLGRASTAEEIAFLAGPDSSF